MYIFNNIDELFIEFKFYEVTVDNILYSCFDNTPESVNFLNKIGFTQGQQPLEYNNNCPYIWTRRNDFVYCNFQRGENACKVRFLNGIPVRIINDSRIDTNLELTIKFKEEQNDNS